MLARRIESRFDPTCVFGNAVTQGSGSSEQGSVPYSNVKTVSAPPGLTVV